MVYCLLNWLFTVDYSVLSCSNENSEIIQKGKFRVTAYIMIYDYKIVVFYNLSSVELFNWFYLVVLA